MEPEYIEMISSPQEASSGVTIGSRAKGPPSITVRVYHMSVQEAASQAVELFDRLTILYQEKYDEQHPPEPTPEEE